jgi:subtilisin
MDKEIRQNLALGVIKHNRKIFLFLFVSIIFFRLVSFTEAAEPERLQKYSHLIDKAHSRGGIRIIVGLSMPFSAEGHLPNEKAIEQRAKIVQLQDQLLESVQGFKIEGIKRFKYIPYIAMEVDSSALSALISHPLADSIEEDVPVPPLLDESVPLIKADEAWNLGYTGSGWTVAILDTGVESNHSFLSGKIVSEACYSSDSWLNNATTVCPNGQESQTGSGAGINCDTSIYGCDHGTHVAGIAAGKGSSFSGVAKDANIIAIQVFHRTDDGLIITPCSDNSLPSPCALSFTSDQVLGLEQVYNLRDSYNIASVNMSLGGGRYTTNCDTNSLKPAIDNLRFVGIATVIASGNDGYTDAISAPACISTAVSVGATTKTDKVWSDSNSCFFLSLLAPGNSIYSSIPNNEWASFSGTSMAAPHVAGAWAILKQKSPTASVSGILASLQNSGTPITDTRNSITKPRIDVYGSAGLLYTCTDIGSANTRGTAYPLPLFDVPFNAELCDGDTWYSFNLKSGEGITTALTAHLNAGYLRLHLFDKNGSLISYDDASNGQTAMISYRSVVGGT